MSKEYENLIVQGLDDTRDGKRRAVNLSLKIDDLVAEAGENRAVVIGAITMALAASIIEATGGRERLQDGLAKDAGAYVISFMTMLRAVRTPPPIQPNAPSSDSAH